MESAGLSNKEYHRWVKQICSDSNHSFKNNCCTTSNNISPISNHQIQLPTTFPPTLDPTHHITSQNICILHQLKFTVGFLRNYDTLHDTLSVPKDNEFLAMLSKILEKILWTTHLRFTSFTFILHLFTVLAHNLKTIMMTNYLL